MKLLPLGAVALTALLTGCAASPELVSCLQPNRRVTIEVGGSKERPTKPGAKRKAKPQNVMYKVEVQGDLAWNYGEAKLKKDGIAEIDKLLKTINKGTKRDKRPTKVRAVIISGHVDRTELDSGLTNLAESRARAVQDYMVKKGINKRFIFWEGKAASSPVPVTKFCPES